MEIELLEKHISYTFKDKDILKEHLHTKVQLCLCTMNSMNFLGDRVLGLVISETLLKNYDQISEGNLDKVFSTLVNKDICAEVALGINLGNFLILGKTEIASEGKNKLGILADACEALIASIYLDGGFTAAKKLHN